MKGRKRTAGAKRKPRLPLGPGTEQSSTASRMPVPTPPPAATGQAAARPPMVSPLVMGPAGSRRFQRRGSLALPGA